ncbi:hypothetical protein CDD82_5624 [Ophiocordyceps australis]|uniref:Transcription factor domain-containing protein n=1 Tax=Ophiocordyceps australis TaxID=1399860 RepID=A0A2C5Z0L4_9HYPO|nr:hypothetical protein CDD82_5624 [Ophiocordyceps australis]
MPKVRSSQPSAVALLSFPLTLGERSRCLASKIECISRSGPRVRRSRKSRLVQDSDSLSSASSPLALSSTFTIDFSVPERPQIHANFDTLRDTHKAALQAILPEPLNATVPPDMHHLAQRPARPASSISSPSQSQQMLHDLQGRPLFNLASAQSLLSSFSSMVQFFPCIALPHDFSIPHLAATRPFLLLAILAAASASKTLQGHTLYDDEFRKVLGLKYVAGGERSLELLQGILVYCAWYPFHLRPQSRQAFNYLNMAWELVCDLGLEEESATPEQSTESGMTEEQLHGIRAYLGYSYIVSTFFGAWKGRGGVRCHYTPWTATCCEILQRHNRYEGDLLLATLVRLAYTLHDATEAIHERNGQSMQDRQLLLSGLAVQFQQFKDNIAPLVARAVPVKTLLLLLDVYLEGGPLMKLPRATPTEPLPSKGFPILPPKLYACAPNLKTLLDTLSNLDEASFMCFTLHDWTRFIITTIFSLRMSFPINGFPDYDAAWTRSQLQFGDFLTQMICDTDLTATSKKVDVLSAIRIVLGVVKEKYESRLREIHAKPDDTETAQKEASTCPMLDGSLDHCLTLWGDPYENTLLQDAVVNFVPPATDPEEPDMWAAMAMAWINKDNGGLAGY